MGDLIAIVSVVVAIIAVVVSIFVPEARKWWFRFIGRSDETDETVTGTPKNLSHLEQAKVDMNSTDHAKRMAAVHTLKQSTDPAAREALVEATQHPIRDVSIEATFALACRKDKHAVPLLIALLYNQEKRRDAEQVIVSFGECAIPDLITALSGDSLAHKIRVINLLGHIRSCDDTVMSCLITTLRDPDTKVKYAVLDALGAIGGRDGCHVAVLRLRAVAEDPYDDIDIRCAAFTALGKAKDIDFLQRVFQDICERNRGGSTAGVTMPEEDLRIGIAAGKALKDLRNWRVNTFLQKLRPDMPSQALVNGIWGGPIRIRLPFVPLGRPKGQDS